jgi:hypothetical protein
VARLVCGRDIPCENLQGTRLSLLCVARGGSVGYNEASSGIRHNPRPQPKRGRRAAREGGTSAARAGEFGKRMADKDVINKEGTEELTYLIAKMAHEKGEVVPDIFFLPSLGAYFVLVSRTPPPSDREQVVLVC